MKWENIVSDPQLITATEAKERLLNTTSHHLQVVDVRQANEYRESHLPGALSIPLVDLTAGDLLLNREDPVLLYCSNGERSLSAARWLESNGFGSLFVIEGGIASWEGVTAFGHVGLNLDLLNPKATFPDALTMAYAMEEGMRQLYILLARETDDEVFKKLFRELAYFEERHKNEISGTYFMDLGQTAVGDGLQQFGGQVIEGGGYLNREVIRSMSRFRNLEDIFGLAIALETQAMDFYFRLAAKAEDQKVRRFFLDLVDEEKKHLGFISKTVDVYFKIPN